MTFFAGKTENKKNEVHAICGKCRTLLRMEKRKIGKAITYYCPNCDDLISPSAIKIIGDKQ